MKTWIRSFQDDDDAEEFFPSPLQQSASCLDSKYNGCFCGKIRHENMRNHDKRQNKNTFYKHLS